MHFEQPSRRLYLSATVGSVEDLQRRLGTPPLEKLTASVRPRQGERIVLIRDGSRLQSATELAGRGSLQALASSRIAGAWPCPAETPAADTPFLLSE
jgi:hypothetical protein